MAERERERERGRISFIVVSAESEKRIRKSYAKLREVGMCRFACVCMWFFL